jgi:hypothetical protein
MTTSQRATLTPEEKSTLELVGRFKGGELLKRNKTLYFLPSSTLAANVYDISLLDFLLDWGNTPLQLTAEQLTVAKAATIKSSTPLRCEFENGKASDYCELQLSTFPPPAEWFVNKSPEWHYVNEVTKMEVSPQAVPKSVLEEISRMEKHNKMILDQILKLKGNLLENPQYDKIRSQIRVVVVQDKYGALFKFSEMETRVYGHIDAQSFTVVKEPTRRQIETAQELAPIDYDERGQTKPLSRTVYIVADAEQ